MFIVRFYRIEGANDWFAQEIILHKNILILYTIHLVFYCHDSIKRITDSITALKIFDFPLYASVPVSLCTYLKQECLYLCLNSINYKWKIKNMHWAKLILYLTRWPILLGILEIFPILLSSTLFLSYLCFFFPFIHGQIYQVLDIELIQKLLTGWDNVHIL